MFTGIIENQAVVLGLEPDGLSIHLTLESPIAHEFHTDQSVAHDGICLTITQIIPAKNQYQVTAVQETLQKTTISNWEIGKRVNIERCLRLGDRLDGHWVQGHVDTTGTIIGIEDQNGSHLLTVSFPDEFTPLVVPKGSICLNGISLTVVQIASNSFTVAIIPYTYAHTNIHLLEIEATVNLEFDIIGKYFLRFKETFKISF